MTTTEQLPTINDHELKARHRALWALGDYPLVAATVIPSLGPILVEACDVGPGQDVLDVAAGAGNASLPAARAGARVIASDLTPELLAAGRAEAERAGLEIGWDEADAEHLPYADASFDTVLSCVGVMFAPDHQQSADELVRVCRPGGTIGLVSWTPEGFVGQLLAAVRPFAPPPPPGAQPPPLWGRDAHVTGLLGDRVTDIVARRETVRVDAFSRPEDFREHFKACYGPVVAVYLRHADDPAQVAALDAELDALAARHDLGGGAMDWEYLLLTATRR